MLLIYLAERDGFEPPVSTLVSPRDARSEARDQPAPATVPFQIAFMERCCCRLVRASTRRYRGSDRNSVQGNRPRNAVVTKQLQLARVLVDLGALARKLDRALDVAEAHRGERTAGNRELGGLD